ncbi:hypothetical protein RFI_08855 [Reticulomyxa filosa]|uniref:Uncharacterized protein n=1 Tax=Reticulomyxa filosa TaxID=46433 RepID=X6NQT4_RETFI|nr:hypothetical protein RFI_08855 [Reticulomyxa filosa]|eukprot:ETO28278.1 hypothetical protein RFI_08855 [Reticulomyxa filosa]
MLFFRHLNILMIIFLFQIKMSMQFHFFKIKRLILCGSTFYICLFKKKRKTNVYIFRIWEKKLDKQNTSKYQNMNLNSKLMNVKNNLLKARRKRKNDVLFDKVRKITIEKKKCPNSKFFRLRECGKNMMNKQFQPKNFSIKTKTEKSIVFIVAILSQKNFASGRIQKNRTNKRKPKTLAKLIQQKNYEICYVINVTRRKNNVRRREIFISIFNRKRSKTEKKIIAKQNKKLETISHLKKQTLHSEARLYCFLLFSIHSRNLNQSTKFKCKSDEKHESKSETCPKEITEGNKVAMKDSHSLIGITNKLALFQQLDKRMRYTSTYYTTQVFGWEDL